MSLRRLGALAAAPMILAGCGLMTASGGTAVTVTVTRDFGSRAVARASQPHISGSETVLGLLQRRFSVRTVPGGRAVEAINGVSGAASGIKWSWYVNGVQATASAATTGVHAGDQVWWDLHSGHATRVIPAVVGSYPEPFVNGVGGKRLPTTVECGPDVDAACQAVQRALNAARIPFASQYIGTGSGPDTLGIVVGTWRDIEAEVAAGLIANGPGASGVYARFGPSGRTLQLMDAGGDVVRTLTVGAGLVAATADSQSAPTWLVTGTDPAGVADAARQLNSSTLHDRFAIAVQRGTVIPVPITAS